MKKYVVYILISLSFVLFALSACTPQVIEETTDEVTLSGDIVEEKKTESKLDFEIVNQYNYVTGIGYYHITGAVKNTGTVPAKHVRAKIIGYTADGEKEEWGDRIVSPSRLAPGEVGIFDKSMGKEDKYDVGRYETSFDSAVIEEEKPYTEFEVDNVEVVEEQGFYKVYADIINVGEEQAPMYSVVCQFFDADGNAISAGTAFAAKDGAGLKPGDSVNVNFITYHPSNSVKIAGQKVFIDFS